MIDRILEVVNNIENNIDNTFNSRKVNFLRGEEYSQYILSLIDSVRKNENAGPALEELLGLLSIYGRDDTGFFLVDEFYKSLYRYLDENFINILRNILQEAHRISSVKKNYEFHELPYKKIDVFDKSLELEPLPEINKAFLIDTKLMIIYSPYSLKANTISHTKIGDELVEYLKGNSDSFTYDYSDFRINLALFSRILFFYPRMNRNIDDRFYEVINKADIIVNKYIDNIDNYNPLALKRLHSLVTAKNVVKIMLNFYKKENYNRELLDYIEELRKIANSEQMYTSFLPAAKVNNDILKLTLFNPRVGYKKDLQYIYDRLYSLSIQQYVVTYDTLSTYSLSKYFEYPRLRDILFKIAVGDNNSIFLSSLHGDSFFSRNSDKKYDELSSEKYYIDTTSKFLKEFRNEKPSAIIDLENTFF